MTSRLDVVAIDAVRPRVVADFWCAVLGWQVLDEGDGLVSIGPPGGGGPTIDVLPVPERKTVKNRLHLDLRADGVTTAEELRRLLDLGARRVDVGQPPDVTWTVLADPEGNEFCLLGRTVQEVAAERATDGQAADGQATDGRRANSYRNSLVGATANPVMPDPDDVDEAFAQSANEALAAAADLVRTLVGAHQSAVSVVVDGDWSSMRKHFSMSPKYEAWSRYRTPATGFGIHTLVLREARPVRLTQAELEAHELWQGFGTEAEKHPPMRGWLAAPILDRTGRVWGMVQLSDPYEGDFTEAHEQDLVRFVDLLSLTLGGLWDLRDERKSARAAARGAQRSLRTNDAAASPPTISTQSSDQAR